MGESNKEIRKLRDEVVGASSNSTVLNAPIPSIMAPKQTFISLGGILYTFLGETKIVCLPYLIPPENLLNFTKLYNYIYTLLN